jgi:hypothetical protein
MTETPDRAFDKGGLLPSGVSLLRNTTDEPIPIPAKIEPQVPFNKRPRSEEVHTWFSLSYSNYAVLPRTLLQSMPDEWQYRFVALMDELAAEFRHVEQADGYEVTAGHWVYVNECSDAELKLAEVTCSDDDPDYPEGAETVWWGRDGDELQGHDYVFVPGSDPVSHYNRGRTYVAPASVLRELGFDPEGE